MPTYDYECQDCNHVFEVFQYMSDEPLSECPKCKGKVKRLVGGGAGIIFKGSGFYVNDYKKKSSGSKDKSSSAAKSQTKASAKST